MQILIIEMDKYPSENCDYVDKVRKFLEEQKFRIGQIKLIDAKSILTWEDPDDELCSACIGPVITFVEKLSGRILTDKEIEELTENINEVI